MKIGLLSPHYAYNYGAMLQAFALCHYLRREGYDAVILNRRQAAKCDIPSFAGRMARRLEILAKWSSFGKFDRDYLQPQTVAVIHQCDWQKVGLSDFDAVIVGSDQVWRDDYAFNSFGYNLFLDFTEGYHLKRIAYAPSLGKATWQRPADVTLRVKELLARFDAVSVREDSSVDILQKQFGVRAQLVLDPTMLLTAADYRRAFNLRKLPPPKRYIAAYLLDYDHALQSCLQQVSATLHLPVRLVRAKGYKGRLAQLLNRFLPVRSVTAWVQNIANADFVVTNSFHGMVFSIIFRKQFIVFINTERGAARFHSLLGMFGLESRLVTSREQSFLYLISERIDYAPIEPAIARWQEISRTYLHNALEE